EFSIAGSLANATVEFNDSLGFDSPTGLTIDVPASGQPQIRFDWDLTLGAGQSMTIGFKYGSFSLNMDVYERTREVEITQHIETTTVTDIRDIDFEPPKIPIQAGETEQDVIKVPVFDADAAGLHLTNIGVMPPANPRQSLSKVDTALTTITSYRSIYGAFQNRLEHTFNNVGNYAENLTASESRIRDADMAKEMVDYSKNNILLQATQSLLAQANSTPQGVLGLLK
ncbi:MAG: flagellar protein, partial [Cohnella sp.]|nr:flagellar protein [Cohnella sp.]